MSQYGFCRRLFLVIHCQFHRQFGVSQSHPRVTRLAPGIEDTSYTSVFSNVWIDGDWAVTTGTTFPLPSGTYYVQVSDYNGVFHYFDVNGTSVYDNPANHRSFRRRLYRHSTLLSQPNASCDIERLQPVLLPRQSSASVRG